jgi:glutamate-5-semialdehyde dehydrogenase
MTASNDQITTYCREVAQRARRAASELAVLPTVAKNAWLRGSAAAVRAAADRIVVANERDLAAAPDYGLTAAAIDRLRLTPERIEAIATGLEDVAALPDPIGHVIESRRRPNGLQIDKVRVPLGVVLFIYESRPNVTADAAAICVKSGNAIILRGGKEAAHSSGVLVELLAEQAAAHGVPTDAVQYISTTDRAAVGALLKLGELIDVVIPRGGEGLIRRVASEATMPVIKHFDGNCHVYIDDQADPAIAERIVVNSKCQRLGVCNAAESLVVHSGVAKQMLPQLAAALMAADIEIRGDAATCLLVPKAKPATDEDFRAEYLGPIISVAIVDSVDEAIDHINRYGSHHTDAIVSNSVSATRKFAAGVDSSAVMINASTRFNDGGEFGLGAEIGISTDKFHARGPCGLEELTSYKYLVYGDGQIRE